MFLMYMIGFIVFSYGMSGDMFHLVGHSLGAHAVVYYEILAT